jgi:hypothetical protein
MEVNGMMKMGILEISKTTPPYILGKMSSATVRPSARAPDERVLALPRRDSQ